MFKLLKYEIKESSKYFIYTIIGNVIASVILAIVIGSLQKSELTSTSAIFSGLMFLAAFSLFIAAYVGFIFMTITSYRKDLYTDSAYLKFSLPITGFDFLNAKTLLLIFWGFIMAAVTIIVNSLVYAIVFRKYIGNIMSGLSTLNISITTIITIILLLIVAFIEGLILLYFCITFVKSYFKKSKKGYIWFIVYILFNIAWSIVDMIISKISPFYLSIGTNVTIEKFPYYNLFEVATEATTFFNYNIVSLILYLILSIGLYIFTAYMLDKKVDI